MTNVRIFKHKLMIVHGALHTNDLGINILPHEIHNRNIFHRTTSDILINNV